MRDETLPPMAPVFPLPNCVLFPKVLLPLRIFEPRYKKMLQDMLDTKGWLAIGFLKTEKELDAEGKPDVFPVAGLGRLVDYQKAPDGTFKVVILGEQRVRLNGWIQQTPYPIARIQHFPELEPDCDERNDIRVRLRQRIKDLVRKSVDSQVLMLLDQTIKACEEIGPLVDSIAYHFLNSPTEKQRLLEVSSAVDREKLLIEVLKKERFGEASIVTINIEDTDSNEVDSEDIEPEDLLQNIEDESELAEENEENEEKVDGEGEEV